MAPSKRCGGGAGGEMVAFASVAGRAHFIG
ncbi:MAG: SAM-dependent methyltransferase [Syntrophobacteraceae bacterium]|nr:SAM-dependent methyltransferase [Syntrophobacteraceae bacterium]